ncbi:MAG TPA: YdeI/OmpD-associated family protein [Pyrinomonadaceae bacterium]|nr:YdeI/OmpD-associated family protein [Pyrinomonadaceae bacterium]
MATKRFRVLLEKNRTNEATAITVPFDVQKTYGTRARVPVRGTINRHPYRGTIFPMRGKFIFVVNRELRAAAGVKGGDLISMTMERDEEPRIITPPPDLARALKANKAAQIAWDKLSYTHKKEHARAVEDAKRPETRVRRIEKAVAQLAEGKKP